MGQQVCMGAVLMCSFGVAPSSLVVLPSNRVMTQQVPGATIMDHVPFVNILPFAMCQSMANPAVAAATAAALGVLTPMPCTPVTAAPWTPGSPTVLIGSMPALNNASTLICSFGGSISISFAGQATVNVP